jgi:curli production assembly/transport component CsgG/holdfast attachment protein HfaB
VEEEGVTVTASGLQYKVHTEGTGRSPKATDTVEVHYEGTLIDGKVFDMSAGDGGLEPVQLAVRALIERATVEFMANLYGAPGPEVCLNAGPDPLGSTVGPTGGYYAAYPNTDTNNGQTRADPSRWHDRRDDSVRRSRY